METATTSTTPCPCNSTLVKLCFLPMKLIYVFLFPFYDSTGNTFMLNKGLENTEIGKEGN